MAAISFIVFIARNFIVLRAAIVAGVVWTRGDSRLCALRRAVAGFVVAPQELDISYCRGPDRRQLYLFANRRPPAATMHCGRRRLRPRRQSQPHCALGFCRDLFDWILHCVFARAVFCLDGPVAITPAQPCERFCLTSSELKAKMVPAFENLHGTTNLPA